MAQQNIPTIREAARRLVRELGFLRGTLAGTNLPPSAVHALIEIGAARALTAAELGERLALEKSSVSRMIRKLISSGEVAEAASGRTKPLSLTEKGRATLAAIDRFAEAQVGAALARLRPGADQTVLDGLTIYAAALRASRTGEAITIPAPPRRLTGKVCLVTGGGTGIGRATALRLAREGAAAIMLGGRRRDPGEAVATEIRGLGAEALFLPGDVTREEDAAALVAETIRRFGRLDCAFNNAGFQERRAPLADQADATYAMVFDTNVRGLLHCLRHQVPAMLATGGGAIVNNTSVSGVRNPNPGLSLYAASKAAAISLTRSAALEYAPAGLRINAIAPGRVVTEMMLASGIGDMGQVAAGLPLRRMGQPEEVAAAVCWLLSDEASYVVGHVLCADGGFLVT